MEQPLIPDGISVATNGMNIEIRECRPNNLNPFFVTIPLERVDSLIRELEETKRQILRLNCVK